MPNATPTSSKFVLYNSNWDYELTVLVGGTLKKALKYCKGLKLRHLKGTEPEAYGAVFGGNIIDHVMWFYQSPAPGLLAHEAFHSVEYVMNFINVPHSQDTSEVYSHTLEWAVRETWKKLHTVGMISLPPDEPGKQSWTNILPKKN